MPLFPGTNGPRFAPKCGPCCIGGRGCPLRWHGGVSRAQPLSMRPSRRSLGGGSGAPDFGEARRWRHEGGGACGGRRPVGSLTRGPRRHWGVVNSGSSLLCGGPVAQGAVTGGRPWRMGWSSRGRLWPTGWSSRGGGHWRVWRSGVAVGGGGHSRPSSSPDGCGRHSGPALLEGRRGGRQLRPLTPRPPGVAGGGQRAQALARPWAGPWVQG